MTTHRPPAHLGRPGRRLWKSVTGEFALAPHQLELLRLAAEATDRADEARQLLDEQGLTFHDRAGLPRSRPEVAVERDSRLAVARLLRELALEPGDADARPPRAGGRT